MKTILAIVVGVAFAACSGKGTQANGAAGADSAVAEVKTIADVPAAQGRADPEEAAVDDVERDVFRQIQNGFRVSERANKIPAESDSHRIS